MKKRVMRALKAPFLEKHATSPRAVFLKNEIKLSRKYGSESKASPPLTQPTTFPESMHPRLSSLEMVRDWQVTSARRIKVSQLLELTARLGGDYCTAFNLEMKYRHMVTWNLTKHLTGPQKPKSPNDWPLFRPEAVRSATQ